jgi:hypothetical protein
VALWIYSFFLYTTMADNKKSFVLYADLIYTVNKMPNDKAGELLKHILSYVNDEEPETDDLIIQLTFEPIKQQLKRDLKKYEIKRKQWSEAGKRSAEVRKKQRTLTNVEKRSTDLTVNDNVNVNVSVNVKDINSRKQEFYNSLIPFLQIYEKEMIKEFYEYWTEHGEKDKKFRKEKEKSFNLELRLKTWFKRSKQWQKEKSSAKKEKVTAAQALREKYGIETNNK